MTFSARATAELCRVPIKKRCCAVAEAYGVLLYCSQSSSRELRIVTASEAFAARLPRTVRRASNPGIGETLARALLGPCKTVTAVSEADLAEREGAPGMTKPAARRVWEHFHPPEGPQTPPKVGEEGPNPGEIAPNS